eukprot:765943-Hanusia_phi.AAC.1
MGLCSKPPLHSLVFLDRYLMKAWERARASADIPDSVLFEVARLLLSSGYLDGNSDELNRRRAGHGGCSGGKQARCAKFFDRPSLHVQSLKEVRMPRSVLTHRSGASRKLSAETDQHLLLAAAARSAPWMTLSSFKIVGSNSPLKLQALVDMGMRLAALHSSPVQ